MKNGAKKNQLPGSRATGEGDKNFISRGNQSMCRNSKPEFAVQITPKAIPTEPSIITGATAGQGFIGLALYAYIIATSCCRRLGVRVGVLLFLFKFVFVTTGLTA